MTKDRAPHPMVTLTSKGLMPTSPFDAEELEAHKASGSAYFELVPRSSRRGKHHRLYWQALNRAVKATGKWPSAAHLHDELKWACGYRRKGVDMKTGDIFEVVDSIAFGKMNQKEFSEYFTTAMQVLGDAIGYDPLMFMGQS